MTTTSRAISLPAASFVTTVTVPSLFGVASIDGVEPSPARGITVSVTPPSTSVTRTVTEPSSPGTNTTDGARPSAPSLPSTPSLPSLPATTTFRLISLPSPSRVMMVTLSLFSPCTSSTVGVLPLLPSPGSLMLSRLISSSSGPKTTTTSTLPSFSFSSLIVGHSQQHGSSGTSGWRR